MTDMRTRLVRLLQDPRVAKVLQDQRVQSGIMRALRFRGQLGDAIDHRVERVAQSLNLATKKEVRELKRTIRRLEEEVRRRDSQSSDGANGHPNAPA